MNPITYLVDHMMLPFLSFSYNNIYPNYGIAIILLTVAIKIVFYPLTIKQFESMKKTQKLQPEIKKIQEKYKEQPDKLQKEMLKLWKDKKANPLGGCLPAIIQMPVFIAVFYTIKSAGFIEMIAQPGINPGLFTFWISNLGVPDGTYILPCVIAISTFWSQKLMMVDKKQQSMMWIMAGVMFIFSINLPAGVLLYWAASQLMSTGQQYMIMKKTG